MTISRITLSSSFIPFDASYKNKIRSASSADCLEYSIPISSTFPTSSLSRIPAVSISVIATSQSRVSFKTSRVVPAISVTIARSTFSSVLNNEDFPTLGLPTIAILIPWRIMLEEFADDNILFILSSAFSNSEII